MYYQSQSPQRDDTKSEESRAMDDQRFYQDLLVRVLFIGSFSMKHL